MDTRLRIIDTANTLIVERGYNAFSYKDISEKIGIKTSSIHYHFPTKSVLGIAVVQQHQQAFEQTIARTNGKTPIEKIGKLFLYYKRLVAERKVCIAGAMTSDINTLDESLREQILAFSDMLINWTTSLLKEGEAQKVFKPIINPELKAKQIIASLMALAQFTRIEKSKSDFDLMTKMMLDELKITV